MVKLSNSEPIGTLTAKRFLEDAAGKASHWSNINFGPRLGALQGTVPAPDPTCTS
jgi:hypothetical protein